MGWSLNEPDDVFYLSYGRCLANWARVETAMAWLFLRLTDMEQGVGLAVFYSAKSFHGRKDMILACEPLAQTSDEGHRFLVRSMGRAKEWAFVRNQLAHDQHGVTGPRAENDGMRRAIFPLAPRHKPSSRPFLLTREEIDVASENFGLLAELLEASLGKTRVLRNPELIAALFDQLPVNPLHRAADPDGLAVQVEALSQSEERSLPRP